MEIEILTLEIIRKDVKKHFTSALLGGLVLLPLFAIMSVIIVFFMTLVLNLVIPNKETLKIIGNVVLILLGIFYLYGFWKIISTKIGFLKGEIQITDDWLVDKLPRRYGKYHHRPNTLVFARSGECGLNDDFYYRWSNLYSMSEASLYRSSNLDDEFYVVSVGKIKNIIAYNKKMFELRQ